MKKYDYGYLEDIKVRRDENTLHKFKEGDFPNLNLHDIEDMMLLLFRKKNSNLERDVIFDLNVALWIFTRSIVVLKWVEDLQLGVESYQKKLNITKPETFRSDISKLTPYTAYKNPPGIIYQDKLLHDITSSLEMDYLPKRTWSKLDRKRSRIMIKAIDQQLVERRLMRNLEKFVRGREYGNDFRLLKQTIWLCHIVSFSISVLTEMELVLEQTQQGTSYEVSVSTERVEELKRKVKIKGEKKEALLTLRQKPGQYICYQNYKDD
ncbi:hypothetical protein Tco_0998082 [Tanacetum coccineum]